MSDFLIDGNFFNQFTRLTGHDEDTIGKHNRFFYNVSNKGVRSPEMRHLITEYGIIV